MEKKEVKTKAVKGRPKKDLQEIRIEGDFVVLKIPKKNLAKLLLGELLG